VFHEQVFDLADFKSRFLYCPGVGWISLEELVQGFLVKVSQGDQVFTEPAASSLLFFQGFLEFFGIDNPASEEFFTKRI